MPKKRQLIEISSELEFLENEIDMNEGEMSDEIEIKLGELVMEERDKLLNVGKWVKKIDMELAGLKEYKKEVSDRYSKLGNLRERFRVWLFKCAKLAGYVKGNEKDGWVGEKIECDQVKISWRRSEVTEVDERDELLSSTMKSHAELWDFKIRVSADGGRMLNDMVETGEIEILERYFRASEAKKLLAGSEVLLSGVRLVKHINPQIKG